MDVQAAAENWARTWEQAWPVKDSEAIAGLYADNAVYRSSPFSVPEPGGARAYTRRQFALEEDVRCRFGEPLVAGERAAVEWWASWLEAGAAVTLAGATVLRFDPGGRVVEQMDYWVQAEGRHAPSEDWGG